MFSEVILLVCSKQSKLTGSWSCTGRGKKKLNYQPIAKVSGNKNYGEEILPRDKTGNWGKSYCLCISQENSCSLLHAKGTSPSHSKDANEWLPNPLNISLLLWIAPQKRTRQRPLTNTYCWEINFSDPVIHSKTILQELPWFCLLSFEVQ